MAETGKNINKDTSRAVFDTSFIINGITYHFECQYTNDGIMVFRMCAQGRL
ncbi:MAG: hypothetical protein OSJ45_07420 [Lachnospiraceae bacterium]|nr:hypothetical protein [Lachnospiraceae bacterium]